MNGSSISDSGDLAATRQELRQTPKRVFLLSPANAAGVRARLILGNSARTDLAMRLASRGAPLGEVFSFISGLYFRGKLSYATAYTDPPTGANGVFVITASGGLVSPERVFTLAELRAAVAGEVSETHLPYREPLERDARVLRAQIGEHCEVVLLGSIATQKYVEPLLGIFGDSLVFPKEFIGRGDMSRGGLLLRCVRDNAELEYLPVSGAQLSGRRPAKLPKPRRG
jgi:hypothetical protein